VPSARGRFTRVSGPACSSATDHGNFGHVGCTFALTGSACSHEGWQERKHTQTPDCSLLPEAVHEKEEVLSCSGQKRLEDPRGRGRGGGEHDHVLLSWRADCATCMQSCQRTRLLTRESRFPRYKQSVTCCMDSQNGAGQFGQSNSAKASTNRVNPLSTHALQPRSLISYQSKKKSGTMVPFKDVRLRGHH